MFWPIVKHLHLSAEAWSVALVRCAPRSLPHGPLNVCHIRCRSLAPEQYQSKIPFPALLWRMSPTLTSGAINSQSPLASRSRTLDNAASWWRPVFDTRLDTQCETRQGLQGCNWLSYHPFADLPRYRQNWGTNWRAGTPIVRATAAP